MQILRFAFAIAAPLSLWAQPSHDQTQVIKLNDSIYEAVGRGGSNTFLVLTRDGNVVIDTSSLDSAASHVQALRAVSKAPIRYIVLTHAHWDHTGGPSLWKEAGAHVVAQRSQIEFLNYMKRLNNFHWLRNVAQFGFYPDPKDETWAGNYAAKPLADIFFDDNYEFTVGGVRFELYHTPGETPDHLTVWIPQYKAAFTGDNYGASFPALYTLRGTEPRWALDYISSINRVLALKPEILLPSHGMPVRDTAEITRRLTKYRDAIQYVHDETVKGMNAGNNVYQLMHEIHLPPELALAETNGKVSWSVRGIYEAYAGWFDMRPETMYETPAASVYADVVRAAGGPNALVKLAQARIENGKPVEALHLTSIALAADATNRGALEVRLKALDILQSASRNYSESAWLDFALRETKQSLAAASH